MPTDKKGKSVPKAPSKKAKSKEDFVINCDLHIEGEKYPVGTPVSELPGHIEVLERLAEMGQIVKGGDK